MTDMVMVLRALRQIAVARSQTELDIARIDAADVLDQAGWEKSARIVTNCVGLPIAPPDSREDLAKRT